MKRKDNSTIKRPLLKEYKKEHERRLSHDETWYRACRISLPLYLDFLYERYNKNCFHASQEHIKAFVDYLEHEYISPYKKKLSRRTINFYLADIKTFYNWLKDSKKIKHNPAKDVKRLKVIAPDNKRKFLKRNEILEVIDWIEKDNSKTPKRDIAIIGLMFDPWGRSGCMRMGEVLALDLDDRDVNFKEDIIHITKTLGKFKVEKTTKTHEPRNIPMTSKIKEILLDYIGNERKEPEEGNPLFVGTKSGRRLSKAVVNDIFKNIEKKSGLKFRCKLRSHVGRHSAVTKIVNDPNCSIKYAQRTTGIKSMEVLEGYSHDITDEDRRIAEGEQPTSQGKLSEILSAIKGNNLSKKEKAAIIAELIG